MASSFEHPIQLVLTDIVMPEIDGQTLVRDLSKVRPGIRSLLMSGYPADHWESGQVAEGSGRLLSKPFTPSDLLAAVREALESSPVD